LNELKGPTDIINFVDSQFIYINFIVDAYVSDKRYSLEEVRSNIENSLRDKYSLENTNFKEDLYFSQYYEFINSIAGVNHHTTTLMFSVLTTFTSAYVFNLDLGLNQIEPGSVDIYIKTQSATEWTHIASDDNNGNIIGELIDPLDPGQGSYDLPGASIDYASGFGGEIIINFGITEEYSTLEIKVDFGLDSSTSGNLLLTTRQQIYSYYSSTIRTIAMETT
jgi:hypothetical protein